MTDYNSYLNDNITYIVPCRLIYYAFLMLSAVLFFSFFALIIRKEYPREHEEAYPMILTDIVKAGASPMAACAAAALIVDEKLCVTQVLEDMKRPEFEKLWEYLRDADVLYDAVKRFCGEYGNIRADEIYRYDDIALELYLSYNDWLKLKIPQAE